jgi:hypothetical protein
MTRRLILASLVVLAGCSSGSSSTLTTSVAMTATAAPTTAAATITTAPPTTVATTVPTTVATTTTATPTTAAATPIEVAAQQLLDRYDAAATAILVDPRVASDSANPKVLAYLALFPADSKFAKGTVDFWAQEGAQGRFYKPGTNGKLFVTTLKKVLAQSATEASVSVCTVDTITIVSETGTVLESSGGISGGEVVMVKSGDQWLLRDLSQTPAGHCPKPGSGG